MKNLTLIVLAGLSLAACSKKPENSAVAVQQPSGQIVTTGNVPTSCHGSTIPWSLTAGQTVADNSSKAFVITGFDAGCGDTLNVYIRKDSGQAWFQLGLTNMGASYYSLSNNLVTVFNATGIVQEVSIEAVLN